MFTTLIEQPASRDSNVKTTGQKVTDYLGVDLSGFECYKLMPNPLFQKYDEKDVHFAIGAVQKGMKPPTDVGLKRMKMKNAIKRKNRNQKRVNLNADDPDAIQPLNPQSAELICMKALRRKFKQQIAPSSAKKEDSDDQSSVAAPYHRPINHKKAQPKPKQVKEAQQQKNARRKSKFIRKKQNQLRRRIELINLVSGHFKLLQKIFGEKIQGYKGRNSCPKVSRHQVRAALTKHYQEKIKQAQEKIRAINDPEEMKKVVDEALARGTVLPEKKRQLEAPIQQRSLSDSDQNGVSDSSSEEP